MVKENLEAQRPSRNETFEIKVMSDLARLSDLKIKALLDEVHSKDLVFAMQQANDEVIDKILVNLPPWQAERVDFRMVQYQADKRGLDQARERVLKKAAQIAQQTDPPKKEPREAPMSLAVQAILDKLQRNAFSAMTWQERAELFVDMAAVVEAEGMLALEPVVGHIEQNRGVPMALPEGLLATGLRLIVDGTEAGLVLEILEANARGLLRQYEMRCLVVLDGVVGMLNVSNVALARLKMEVHYGSVLEAPHEEGRFTRLKQRLGVNRFFSELGTQDKFADALSDSLHSRLQETPFSTMNLPEVCHFFCDLFMLKRVKGIDALKAMPEAVDEVFPRKGLRLLIKGAEPEQIRQGFEGQMQALLHQQEIGYQMIMTGIEALQAKEGPRVVKEKMREIYEV